MKASTHMGFDGISLTMAASPDLMLVRIDHHYHTRLRMNLLDKLGVGFNRLAGSAIDLLHELGKLASDVGGVAVQNWSVTGADLAGMVEKNNLGVE